MAIENPSVLYLEQSLSPEQKTVVCENIGAVRTIAGKGLSTEDFTTAEKNKLSDVESGAEANVIEEITVNGTAVTPVNKSVALTIPSAITVDQTYNGSSTNPQSGIAVSQALAGTGQVPTVTSNDDGKVLKASYDSVTSQGSFRWDSAPSGVPSTTSSDEGKVLGVTNSTGTLGWVSQTPAAHDSTVTVKTGDSTPVTLGSFTTDQSSNSDITIPLAVPTGTGEKSGLMSAADKAKLDGLTTFSTSDNGLVPKPTSQEVSDGKYLKSDGSWGVPTDTTYSTFDTTTDGLVPKANGAGDTDKFLKGDGSWATPTDTTYSGGDGIDIIGTVVSVDIASSGSGLEFSSNKLKVNGNASQAIEVGASGVGIKLATGSGLEFSSGLKVKTDGSTIHTNASGALEVIGGGGGTTYTAGDGIDIASSTIKANIDTAAGLKFDSSDPKKIQVNAGTNIGFNSSTGALDVPTVVASVSGVGGTDGVMLAADKEKLNRAVTYTDNTITGEDDMLAQQMVVVTSDNDIMSFVQGGHCNGLGTIFFRVTGR